MNVKNTLLKDLICKKNNLRIKSYAHDKTFQKCVNILNTFHTLEVNPTNVTNEMEDLCFKLDVHALDHKSKCLRFLCERIIKLCNEYLDKDAYLLSHSVILFLIEIHESMIHSDYTIKEDYYNFDNCITSEDIDWGRLLRDSDDIVDMTRHDYDCESDCSSNISINENDSLSPCPTSNAELVVSDEVRYDLVINTPFSVYDLELTCRSNLQSEYWMDSAYNNTISSNSAFINSFEQYLSIKNPVHHQSELMMRVSMTEYQFIREVLDVFLGARKCTIWKLSVNQNIIVENNYTISKTCKVSNLSWTALDNLSASFAIVATNCLHLRIVSAHIIENCSVQTIEPPLIALGERLYAVISEFCEQIVQFESQARGNVGLSILEFNNALTTWAKRLSFLNDLIVCVTSGRLDSLEWHSTVVSVLDLLYSLMNESCLLDIDPWTITCVHHLFFHCFRPYLFSLDSLLCGQTHLSSTNLFLNKNDNVCPSDIYHYYQNHFTIRRTGTQSLVSTIPLPLHPLIVHLISTITSIDILRLLSIELTRPDIVNTIVKDAGTFINHFNITDLDSSVDDHTAMIRKFVPGDSYTLIDPLSREIFASIITSLTRDCNPTPPKANTVEVDDLVAVCRQLHRTLIDDITDRYLSVNGHLMSVFVNSLGLDQAMDTIRSVFFLQAGFEMYDLCTFLFASLIDLRNTGALTLHANLKMQQILSESSSPSVRNEASRLMIKITVDGSTVVNEFERMIAILSSFTVNYNVSWALQLVITENVLNTSNCCMRFLLQLRFAKYCLESAIQNERHVVRDQSSRQRQTSSQRRMWALRFKLLQIMNSFDIYIMNTFIVPTWRHLDSVVKSRVGLDDFTDFIHKLHEPFNVMARGCLQTEELKSFNKAISFVIWLGIKTGLVEPQYSNTKLEDLEKEYKRLVDFISAMFKGLSNLGISIIGLDITAFQ